jgi:hypothetical protein
MQVLRTYFVERDDLRVETLTPNLLCMRGRIVCKHGLFVDVYKILELNEFDQIRTEKYDYHAGVIGPVARSIFRYDNAHEHTSAGHQDRHHKHVFNHRTWEERTPPEWIGHANWRTLKQVVDELHEWWQDIGRYLDLPIADSD